MPIPGGGQGDDAPSFSFFQNIVSKEQGDDESLFLKAHWKSSAIHRKVATA
jgi:hypothetical protein